VELPAIRDWTERHFDFAGYVSGFDQPSSPTASVCGAELGYRPGEQVCIVTVGGSGVGGDLLRRVIASAPDAKDRVHELRMIVVAGPRIDPRSVQQAEGLQICPYVHHLYRHLEASEPGGPPGRPDDGDAAHRQQAAVPLLPPKAPLSELF
jgi:predicted glycosyltransferase